MNEPRERFSKLEEILSLMAERFCSLDGSNK